ncbi:MAG: dTDP-4-dehydrorhamnose reductase [Planctomycetes bacterium]|nr:dTDP-4-dehydrorhamnose reductase [Planctomycetota bacterium]
MKLMITGAKGMLGRTLLHYLDNHELIPVDLEEFDITDKTAVLDAFEEYKPEAVIHCAAMTAVDACESEPEKAHRINAAGSENIAIACQQHQARLLAISTDYVFSGELDRPYREDDATGPRSVYGESKLAGEEAVRKHCLEHLILRIAWLYGQGGPSFLHTMLRLGRAIGEPLKVVDDQRGNPTSADAIAAHLKLILEKPISGTLHLTCEGETTWYGFTREIFRLAGISREVVACKTSEFPRPAPRPANSSLEKSGLRQQGLPPMPEWKDALHNFMETYPNG